MKRHILVFIQLFIFNFIFIITIAHYIRIFNSNNSESRFIYNDNWDITTNDITKHYDTLPYKIKSNNTNEVILSKKISNIPPQSCIGFFSFQQEAYAYIDGVEVYHFTHQAETKSKTPGNKWNFIHLYSNHDEINFTIKLVECYSSSHINIPKIYYGTESEIMIHYLSHFIPRTVFSFLMILFGVFITCFFIIHVIKRGKPIQKGIVWLGLFAIFRGTWTLIEGNAYSYFMTDLLQISRFSYICLKMAVTTFLLFINSAFHNNKDKIFTILTYLSLADFFGSIICQYLGILDFAYTVYLTHILLIIGCVYTCINSILTLRKNGKNASLSLSRQRRMAINAQHGSTVFLLAGSLIDLTRYYTVRLPDVAKYSRIGDLIYITSVSFAMFFDFVYLLRTGQQAAIIREKASLDPMTELKNRATFEQDMIKTRRFKNVGIVILDLNNLKSINDNLGHDAGDKYIIDASKLISSAFSDYGSIYRIGGDEFCVIARDLNLEKFEGIQKEIEAGKMPFNNFGIGIASGFALFDMSVDVNLNDTMKRADDAMYKRKELLKSTKGT